MNPVWRFVRVLWQTALLAALLAFGAGCGAVAAITNPSAAWGISEPAPMGVVVRRAEVASATAEAVQRLLGDTGIDEKSAWAKRTALKKADAEAILKEIAGGAPYAGTPGAQLRVVPAEAWAQVLMAVCSEEGEYNSVIEALSADAGEMYDALAEQQKQIADLKAEIAAAEKEMEAEGKSDADKAALEKKVEEAEAQIEKIEESYEPAREAFLEKLGAEAAKLSPKARARLGGLLVNLKRAVADAKIANAVALIRYPIAIPGMTDDVQSAARRIVADIIEEQTGSRPDMSGLKPDVKLDGLDVELTLSGVPAEKLGDISPGDLVEQTTVRLKDYVARVFELTAFASRTQDLLAFEEELIDAALEGMGVEPATAEGAGDDLSELTVTSTGAPSKGSKKEGAAPKGERTPGGLIAVSCEASDAGEGKTAKAKGEGEEEEEAKPSKEAKPAKPGKEAKPAKPSKEAKPAKQAAEGKPAKPAATKPAAPPSGQKPCDVWVTSGDKKICL